MSDENPGSRASKPAPDACGTGFQPLAGKGREAGETVIYRFGEYELDIPRYELRRAGEHRPVEPQVFDLLAYLLRHRGRVISKQELFEALWPGKVVGESALTSRLKAARRAIGDSGSEQRLIVTVHGRGYRFVGEVEEWGGQTAPPLAPEPESSEKTSARCVDAVCRDEELGVLRDHLEAALEGSRRIVFITGEPGVGKTTLVDAFAGADALTRSLRLAMGQCIEHRGAGEAYLPVLEALGRLCRGAGSDAVVDILAREAPGWLVQMPGLLDAELQETVQRRALGATRERMLREMVGALESLSADRPLVLWLEDLQWSDGSTIDLLDLLARRREAARLLVIGSFRPAGAADYPVRDVARDLTLRGYSHLITLAPLTAEQVEVWLSTRFAGAVPGGVARVLHLRTGGNPLFMENVVAYWLSEGRLKERDDRIELVGPLEALSAGVPESLRLALNRQIELLPDRAQDVLEAAAVSGVVCRSASVAAILGVEIETAEDELAELAHRDICLSPGSPEHWADGTETASFSFTHNLYQDVIYGRISPAKRARMHYSIGERLETGYGEDATEHAAELALHFVRGRDSARAVQYLKLAAEQGFRLSAHKEALAHLEQALELLSGLPKHEKRMRLEADLHAMLAPATIATLGWKAPQAEASYLRASELYERLGDEACRFSVRYGVAVLHEIRGEYPKTQSVLEDCLSRLRDHRQSGVIEAHELLACSLYHQGAFENSVQHADQGFDVYRAGWHNKVTAPLGENPGVSCLHWASLALWFQGLADQALIRAREGMRLARGPDHGYCLPNTEMQVACLHQHRGEPEETLRYAEQTITLGERHGQPYRVGIGMIFKGWALSALGRGAEGVLVFRQGLDAYRATGAEIDHPYYLALLADACARAGRPDEALAAVDEALTRLRGLRGFYYDAELYRLRAELLQRLPGETDEAAVEAALDEALLLSREHHARILELRALLSRCRWAQRRGRPMELAPLAELYATFSEGLETPDLKAARALLKTG